ncbi:hypothetical protein RR47_GL002010 [Enterococcus columbae DSM 7374 = ATCC 51263]|nr:hypothetical protein RR47_GL002010 [Enterococcus columbae DSM 7374 = ATCC 51263]
MESQQIYPEKNSCMLYLNEVGHWPKRGYRLLSEMEILSYI